MLVLLAVYVLVIKGCDAFSGLPCGFGQKWRLGSSLAQQSAEEGMEQQEALSTFFFSQKLFSDVGMNEEMMKGVLRDLNIERPSKIQALCYNEILQGTTCIVADQTGSGKTLTYLLPLLQRVVELTRKKDIPEGVSRAPYIVVVTPTTELAEQVGSVVRSLSSTMKFKSLCLTSFSDMDSSQKKLRLGIDILVATPGRLLALLKRKELSLERLQSIVFDEADVLFLDESFPLQPIGAACPEEAQFVFVTATLPDVVMTQILSEFPDCRELTGPGLHRISPTIEEELIDCSLDDRQRALGSTKREIASNQEKVFEKKREALLQAMDDTPVGRTLIFCNTIQQCRKVENALLRADRGNRLRNIFAYHGAIDSRARDENVKNFGKQLLQRPVVMVCTDRASRGMDFSRSYVDHVVLFDFPQEPSEYVRRVGRTGRAGRSGKATVLVYGRQVGIATKVLSASIEGKRIDPVAALHVGAHGSQFDDRGDGGRGRGGGRGGRRGGGRGGRRGGGRGGGRGDRRAGDRGQY